MDLCVICGNNSQQSDLNMNALTWNYSGVVNKSANVAQLI